MTLEELQETVELLRNQVEEQATEIRLLKIKTAIFAQEPLRFVESDQGATLSIDESGGSESLTAEFEFIADVEWRDSSDGGTTLDYRKGSLSIENGAIVGGSINEEWLPTGLFGRECDAAEGAAT